MSKRTGLLAAVLLIAAPALAAQPPDEAVSPAEIDEAIAAPAIDDAAMPPAALAGDPLALPAPNAPPSMEWLRAPRAEPVICPFRGQIDYRPGEIECGLIQVPENREVAGSRSIELHYVRILAKGRDADGGTVEKRSDPVVYLTGGPGAPATYYVQRFKDHRLVERRDLYILEQRGIGSSSQFCRFYAARNRAGKIHEDYAAQQRVEPSRPGPARSRRAPRASTCAATTPSRTPATYVRCAWPWACRTGTSGASPTVRCSARRWPGSTARASAPW